MSDSTFILVVEDDPLIQPLVEGALDEAGYATEVVGDAAAAMSVLEQQMAQVRALVTDVNLGGPSDGWDIARRARELNASLPVVYMSGASAHDWTSRGVPKSQILVKPFAPAELVTAVSSLLLEVNKLPSGDAPDT